MWKHRRCYPKLIGSWVRTYATNQILRRNRMNRRKERKEDHIVWALRGSHLLLLLQFTFLCHLLHRPFFLYTSSTNRQKCQQPFELQLPLFRLKQPNAFSYNRRTEYLKQSLRVPLPLPPDWTSDGFILLYVSSPSLFSSTSLATVPSLVSLWQFFILSISPLSEPLFLLFL